MRPLRAAVRVVATGLTGCAGARLVGLLVLPIVLAACASRAPAPSAEPLAPASSATPVQTGSPRASAARESRDTRPGAGGEVLARNQRVLVYRAAAGDTWTGIAERFLGHGDQDFVVAEANPATLPEAGEPLVVPLAALNPLGVQADRVQAVTILCYHRFGSTASKMVVTPAAFETQMSWLVANGYRVIPLAELAGFLAGRRALPARTVVLTFDDGYESVYRHAFPVLKKFGLPATVFVYTDFLGGGEALSFAQLQEMLASGWVDVQSHSKSHRNLVERKAGESDERYRANLDAEMRAPREALERRLPSLKLRHLAYPYGDADETVLDSAARNGFELAATVVPGGNPFFAHPLMLRRTMIFGDMGLDAFKARLQTSRPLLAP